MTDKIIKLGEESYRQTVSDDSRTCTLTPIESGESDAPINGDLEPEQMQWFNLGYSQGYEQGLSRISELETSIKERERKAIKGFLAWLLSSDRLDYVLRKLGPTLGSMDECIDCTVELWEMSYESECKKGEEKET